MGRWFICAGLGNTFTQPIGYIIIWVQVDGVQGYDEDQITLVVLDLSNFTALVPVILGTPTIGYVMNVIREKEIDALVTPWVNAHVAYLLAVWQVTAMLEDNKVTTRVLDSIEYNEVVTTKGSKMIVAFLSRIIHMQMKTVHWCEVECYDSCPTCWRGVIAPRSDDTEHLDWDAQWQQECHLHSEK